MKTCSICKKDLPIENFSFRNKEKQIYSSNCKECQKTFHTNWYEKHKTFRKKQIHDRRQGIKDLFVEYKLTLECSICSQNHIATLDFHHRDPSEKDYLVSKMWKDGVSFKTIMMEIEKCDILCANCHRILHYDEEQ